MKKITNAEVNVINLNANDVIATSGFARANEAQGYAIDGGFVGARGYYDDEEEEW